MTDNHIRSSPSIDSETTFHPDTGSAESASSLDPSYKYYNSSNSSNVAAELLDNDTSTQMPVLPSVADAIAQMLADLGFKYAFGVAGGAMATIWGALSNSSIQVIHCRHEGGAAFAAVEACFASDRPVVVFTTAGPGLTNSLTGLLAGRGEGAKVILISACTSAAQRGRWAIQETSTYTMPQAGIFTPGVLFDYAITVECAEQLPQISRQLALGLSQSGGFVAHVSIPTGVQTSSLSLPLPQLDLSHALTTPSEETIAHCVQLLTEAPFAIWVGFGARNAAEEIYQLAERTGAAVMCSPRGKGIFPEDHPQFVGVTGLGGHTSVLKYIQESPPLRTLVLGTRLGEPTSFWNPTMVPARGFIHVDIDPVVPGVAYPAAETVPVQADIGAFLRSLLKYLDKTQSFATLKSRANRTLPHPEPEPITPATSDLIRPEVLMAAIQKVMVEGSNAAIAAESGNSFTWATHMLRIDKPNRYRVSTGVGSMGHMVAGVIGIALGRKSKAVAITGDGSMLMNNELNTAVKYQIPAIWIVLNDGRYNMCEQGMKMLKLQGADATIPQVDFVAIARGMRADGIRIEKESELEAALQCAIDSPLPFVVDVIIDPSRLAPSGGRNKSLQAQGVKSTAKEQVVSFPMISE
ncbi:MAG: Acetolactate synthase isozyme 1 large subunit [Chroococcidiopsis sp. SAG 2025]|uniref:scytonemin biosynthesis protein ScyA n=1 Tax=Chroococcidiopsis sp. SAG 2025 TaxID=171389 RepID=UPI002937B603|nr:Acetolactate synthase isozyme 1 large subunit [Chroococcidiopsis sp. SAG 2025]